MLRQGQGHGGGQGWDRLWLYMCQLMIWQEQIKRWFCLWETRSSKLKAVMDSLFL